MVEAITVTLFSWVAMATLTAWLVDTFKRIFPWLDYRRFVVVSGKEMTFCAEHLAALIIAGILSWAVELDFFLLLGISSRMTDLGWILSFIIISQGSHGLHDFFGRLKDNVSYFMESYGADFLKNIFGNKKSEDGET